MGGAMIASEGLRAKIQRGSPTPKRTIELPADGFEVRTGLGRGTPTMCHEAHQVGRAVFRQELQVWPLSLKHAKPHFRGFELAIRYFLADDLVHDHAEGVHVGLDAVRVRRKYFWRHPMARAGVPGQGLRRGAGLQHAGQAEVRHFHHGDVISFEDLALQQQIQGLQVAVDDRRRMAVEVLHRRGDVGQHLELLGPQEHEARVVQHVEGRAAPAVLGDDLGRPVFCDTDEPHEVRVFDAHEY
mmetsp:Transcript_52687/g.160147  ORF Transcript_52687/g.160147 Transcript_52687/m.160147 type:complete len:242 (+) Transcript_52687:169-894(+)